MLGPQLEGYVKVSLRSSGINIASTIWQSKALRLSIFRLIYSWPFLTSRRSSQSRSAKVEKNAEPLRHYLAAAEAQTYVMKSKQIASERRKLEGSKSELAVHRLMRS